MKRLVTTMSVLLFSFATVMVAQDDVYFTPKKQKSVKVQTLAQPVVAERDIVTTQTTTYSVLDDEWYKGRNNDMDADAYNRRYVSAPDTVSVMRDTVYLYVDGEEASVTDRLVRFHDYYDPWYYSSLAWDSFYGMPYDWYYNPWYYAGWGRHGWAWAYNYRWGWYDPWWGPGWGPRWHHGWYPGWGPGWNPGWHRSWVRYNSDGSRGYQNRGGRTVGGNHNYRGTSSRSYAGTSRNSRGMEVGNPGGSRVSYSGNRSYDASRAASRINHGGSSTGVVNRISESMGRSSNSSRSVSGNSSRRVSGSVTSGNSGSSYSGGSSYSRSSSSPSRGGGSFGGGGSSSRGGGGISRGGRR